MIGIKIRELREERGLLLRQVAATLEIDTATLSKMEREVKILRKEHLQKLANIYGIDVTQLMAIWLADKLINILEGEEKETSKKALIIAIEQITI